MEDIWTLRGGGGTDERAEPDAAPTGTATVIEPVVPLDAQSDVVDPVCVPEVLRETLFGPIGEATPATFAILDAAKITNLPELLATSGLEHKCLFTGDAQEELGQVAPWIVALEDDNRFVRSLFTAESPPRPWDYWQQDAGILLRADAPLETLWAHFRKFTKVRMEGIAETALEAWQYFRFYDPEPAAQYFEAIRRWPDRMVQFYRTKDGTVIDAIIAVSSVAETAHVFTPGPLPETPAQAFVFQPRDAAVFEAARRPSFRREVHNWLLRMDEPRFKPFSEDELYALVDHGLREGDALRFTFKEEYIYLLYMMTYMGGWFHKSGRVPEIARILVKGGRARRVSLEKVFPQVYDRLYGSRPALFQSWAPTLAHLKAMRERQGGWTGFSPKAARELIGSCATHLGEPDRAALAEFLGRVELDCDRRKILDPTARGLVLVISFFIGHAFFEDPLFPWAAEIAASHDSLEQAMAEIADYALKRMGKMMAAMNKGAA